MNIYLVRHAEKDTTPKNTEELHYNRNLTEIGQKQSQELSKYLSPLKINKIFSSDMLRAKHTSQIVASILCIGKINESRDLREADPCTNPNQPDRDKIKVECWKDWNFKPKQGESYNQGKKRFTEYFWNKLVKRSNNDDNILLVSHGRVIRLFLSGFLKGGKEAIKERYNHVAITHLQINKDTQEVNVISYNDNSYLPEELRI